MNAVIRLDVPDWQIGQPVTVYFKDTMQKTGICEPEPEPAAPVITQASSGLAFNCGYCHAILWVQKDTGTMDWNKAHHRFCQECGRSVK